MTRLLLDTSVLVPVELATARHRATRAAFDADVRRTLLAAVRRAGRPREAHDLIIAATAAAWDRTVVTSDAGASADLPDVRVHEVRTHD